MEEYLEFTKKLAKEAEKIALRYFSFETENAWKGDGTPLTKADTEINDLVIRRVNEFYPDHSIYGEEQNDNKENSKYVWVCDPIDGTMAFACGLPLFVFSIALVDQRNGQPILGLIYDPIMKNMYWAYKNGGAYRNDQKILVSKEYGENLKYYTIGGSSKKLGFSSLSLQEILTEKKSKVFKFPSFTYGAIQVANGKFAAGVFYHPDGHDVAALKIITEEANGKVTDFNGDERRYDRDGLGCVVSNGILHDEILEYIKAGKLKS